MLHWKVLSLPCSGQGKHNFDRMKHLVRAQDITRPKIISCLVVVGQKSQVFKTFSCVVHCPQHEAHISPWTDDSGGSWNRQDFLSIPIMQFIHRQGMDSFLSISSITPTGAFVTTFMLWAHVLKAQLECSKHLWQFPPHSLHKADHPGTAEELRPVLSVLECLLRQGNESHCSSWNLEVTQTNYDNKSREAV